MGRSTVDWLRVWCTEQYAAFGIYLTGNANPDPCQIGRLCLCFAKCFLSNVIEPLHHLLGVVGCVGLLLGRCQNLAGFEIYNTCQNLGATKIDSKCNCHELSPRIPVRTTDTVRQDQSVVQCEANDRDYVPAIHQNERKR